MKLRSFLADSRQAERKSIARGEDQCDEEETRKKTNEEEKATKEDV
jgi:hypothetical protein